MTGGANLIKSGAYHILPSHKKYWGSPAETDCWGSRPRVLLVGVHDFLLPTVGILIPQGKQQTSVGDGWPSSCSPGVSVIPLAVC